MSTRFQKGTATSARRKKYTEEELEGALSALIKATARLRRLSGGVWSKDMAAQVKVAAGDSIPYNTLKDRFVKRMAEEASPPDKTAKTKARSDARGLLKSLEMKQLYNWTEYTRQNYTPATMMTLRGQVRERACREMEAVMAFRLCCLTVTDGCVCVGCRHPGGARRYDRRE
jgi:hypothetical protein